jgi:hypothetical protein
MKSKRHWAAVFLVVLLGGVVYALIQTGAPPPTFLPPTTTQSSNPAGPELVDQRPLQTAQQFAKMQTTAEEKPFAENALALADKEMDLAFAAAVLGAQEHPAVLTPEAKTIQAQLQKAEDALDASKKRVDALTAAEAKASGSKKDALDDQLDLAKAQLELDQDEVDGAKEDLTRAGGDPQGRIQTMVEEHEAASHSSDSTHITVSEPAEGRGLINRWQQWSAWHRKQLQLWQARHDAESTSASLAAQHIALKKQVDAQKHQAGANASAITGRPSDTAQESFAIANTRRRAGDQKLLTILDKRIANEKQLAEVYGDWISVVAGKQRAVFTWP